MQLLGSLGIDFRLLAAQVVNFVLLMWILTKLLYTPLMSAIDRERRSRLKTEEDRKKLENEKNASEAMKRSLVTDGRKEAEKLVADAGHMTELIKLQALRDAQQTGTKLVTQTKAELAARKKELEDAFSANKATLLTTRLTDIFGTLLSDRTLSEEMDRMYFERLKTSLARLSPTAIWPETGRAGKTGAGAGMPGETKLRAILAKKQAGAAASKSGRQDRDRLTGIVESTRPLTTKEKSELNRMLRSVAKKPVALRETKNPALLAGFSFELAGVLLEHNLMSDIRRVHA
ncbi:ATP synthase F0 subunit B [Patescibacteria group bacterium]|nr:ATP synthase F0 subunit B [Patescibacteria group bacterium]